MHFTETRISAPIITAAERVSNDLAIVIYDPRDEVTADLFRVDYFLATDLETPNLVITFTNTHCQLCYYHTTIKCVLQFLLTV